MNTEDLERIAELEEMKELGDELDEEEREELRELKASLRDERKVNKSQAAWAKAKQVYKLIQDKPSEGEPVIYALTEKPLHQIMRTIEIVDGKPVWVDGTGYTVEKVARPSIGNLGYDSAQDVFWDEDTDPAYT
jgi:hypothetical protein